MSDMVLIMFVCLVCLVKMFIEKYQEVEVPVKKPVVETSSNVKYLDDLTRSEVKRLLSNCFDEEEETIDLDEVKSKFKDRHNKWDKEQEEWLLRPVIDKSDNLFSFNPKAHEERARRNRESLDRDKRYKEELFYESFMSSKPVLI